MANMHTDIQMYIYSYINTNPHLTKTGRPRPQGACRQRQQVMEKPKGCRKLESHAWFQLERSSVLKEEASSGFSESLGTGRWSEAHGWGIKDSVLRC